MEKALKYARGVIQATKQFTIILGITLKSPYLQFVRKSLNLLGILVLFPSRIVKISGSWLQEHPF